MPLLQGSPLALPYYSDVEGAYQEVVAGVNPAVGSPFNYKIQGAFTEYVIMISIVFVTDATAGNRNLFVIPSDGDGNPMARIPANFNHGPSTTAGYTWTIDVTQPYNPPNNDIVVPLPKLIMPSGYSWQVTWLSGGATDHLLQPDFTTIRFPTGQPLDRHGVAQVPTPLLI